VRMRNMLLALAAALALVCCSPSAARAGTSSLGYLAGGSLTCRTEISLGFLYGAGAVPSLDRNRIFARWLQKKLVFTPDSGGAMEAAGALGPNRQVFSLGGKAELTGRLQAYREDGKTLVGEQWNVKLVSGAMYRMVWDAKP